MTTARSDGLRIAMVNDLPPDGAHRGGAEVYIARLSRGLTDLGATVRVITPSVPHAGWRRILDISDPWMRRHVQAQVRAFGADVLHFHNVTRELSSAVFAAAPELPAVVSLHDWRMFGLADPGLGAGRRVVDRLVSQPLNLRRARGRADVALAVSGALAERARADHFRRVEVLPVPADVADVPPPSTGDVVLFAGRLSADKGWRVLMDAWAQIAAEHPGLSLVLAGSGPDADAVVARAATLPRVEVPGQVTDMTGLLARARVVVVPSIPSLRPEGSPMVSVEAALAGRPVVVSDDPGLREQADVFGAAVVPAGDAGALARALAVAVVDPDPAGASGRARALPRHAVPAVAEAARAIYASVLRTGS